MALETVFFQEDPFIYGGELRTKEKPHQEFPKTTSWSSSGSGKSSNTTWESSPTSISNNSKEVDTNSSFPNWGGDGAGGYSPVVGQRRKRRNTCVRNREDVEQQRITHVTVERNRRKLMNVYLGLLRSMMPPSYSQRGDQASIVGGAVNFVKELEQLLQSLESRKKIMDTLSPDSSAIFSGFFTFPQYSTFSNKPKNTNLMKTNQSMADQKRSAIADVEVTMVESHANLKILTRKSPKQLLMMVTGLYSIGLAIVHLNVTSVDLAVLYSFSVKVEEQSQLTSVNEIATAVFEMVGGIQEKATSDFSCD